MTSTSRIQDFMGYGTHAARPAAPSVNFAGTPVPIAFYYETDTTKLYMWDNSTTAWIQVALGSGGSGTPGGSNHDIQYNNSSAFGGLTLTNGQLLIGSTGATPATAALTAGTGITVTNGAGSVTLASTSGLFGGSLGAVPTSSSTGLSTWLNQGSASVADTAAGVTLTCPGGTSANLRVRYKAVPSTPYTITALMALTCLLNTDDVEAGIGWYDGSAKLQTIHILSGSTAPKKGVQVNSWTSTTAYSASPYALTDFPNNPAWLRLKDDGTTVSFQISADGVSFVTVYSIAKASGFLGSSGYSNVVFFANNGTTSVGTFYASLMSYAQA